MTNTTEHGTSIIESSHDVAVNAGYLRFCDCPYGGTDDSKWQETRHKLLSDLCAEGSHVIGLEILNYPAAGFAEEALRNDLNKMDLSVQQKEAVIRKLLPTS